MPLIIAYWVLLGLALTLAGCTNHPPVAGWWWNQQWDTSRIDTNAPHAPKNVRLK